MNETNKLIQKINELYIKDKVVKVLDDDNVNEEITNINNGDTNVFNIMSVNLTKTHINDICKCIKSNELESIYFTDCEFLDGQIIKILLSLNNYKYLNFLQLDSDIPVDDLIIGFKKLNSELEINNLQIDVSLKTVEECLNILKHIKIKKINTLFLSVAFSDSDISTLKIYFYEIKYFKEIKIFNMHDKISRFINYNIF